MIRAADLRRRYRNREGWFRSKAVVEAVRGITFEVPRGTIFGLLGPNGAGKTTTIKMLATLLIPTSGTALVDGFDVEHEEVEVRRRLGVLFGGDKGLHNQLSGLENLNYFGHLYGMPAELITERASELLDQVGLTNRAKERVELLPRDEATPPHCQDAHPPPTGCHPRRTEHWPRSRRCDRGAIPDR